VPQWMKMAVLIMRSVMIKSVFILEHLALAIYFDAFYKL
jgi:hypothetical protein